MVPILVSAAWENVGFNPKWAWPYVAAGTNAAATIYNSSGVVQTSIAAFFAGWWNATTIMVLNDVALGQQRTLLTVSGTSTVQSDMPDTVIGAVASNSQWASNVVGVVRVNGDVIASDSRYLGIALTQTWLWHSSNEGASTEPEWQRWRSKLYLNRVLQRTIKHSVPAHGTCLASDGHFSYGDTARAFVNKPNGADVEVTATTPAVEYAPVLAKGSAGEWWCWSMAGTTAEYLIARRLGSSAGWVYQLPWGASAIDVVWASGMWQLVWNNSVGRMGMTALSPVDAQAVTLPAAYPFTALVPAPAGSTAGTAGTTGTTTTTDPPLNYPLVDAQTGYVTRPWMHWFQRFVHEDASLSGVGSIGASLLPAGPAATILGREVADEPAGWTLGTGLTVEDRELAVAPADVMQYDTRANQPSAADVPIGTLYGVTDEAVVERSNGTTWDPFGTW